MLIFASLRMSFEWFIALRAPAATATCHRSRPPNIDISTRRTLEVCAQVEFYCYTEFIYR
jgi:hypothetical protein